MSVLGGVRPLLSGLFGRYDSPNPSIVVTPSRSTLVEILGSGLDEGESAGFNISAIPSPRDLSGSCGGLEFADALICRALFRPQVPQPVLELLHSLQTRTCC